MPRNWQWRPQGRQNYLKSHFISQVSDDIVDIVVDYFDRITSPLSSILFQYLGNAARRIPVGETAFGQRGALCEWATNAVFLDPGESEVHIRWVRDSGCGNVPHSRRGAYINQVGTEEDEGAEAIQAAFGDNFQRLAVLKQKYDPDEPVQPQPEHQALGFRPCHCRAVMRWHAALP